MVESSLKAEEKNTESKQDEEWKQRKQEWIESLVFENLPIEDEERMKNDEEQRRTSTESLMETSRKRYRSTLAWIFFLLPLVLTNFKWKLSAKIVGSINSTLFPYL